MQNIKGEQSDWGRERGEVGIRREAAGNIIDVQCVRLVQTDPTEMDGFYFFSCCVTSLVTQQPP